jgi:hypothetical protein
MDRVDIHADYDPVAHYKLELEDGKLTAEELAAKHGRAVEVADAGDGGDEAEEAEGEPAPAPARAKRLDG